MAAAGPFIYPEPTSPVIVFQMTHNFSAPSNSLVMVIEPGIVQPRIIFLSPTATGLLFL